MLDGTTPYPHIEKPWGNSTTCSTSSSESDTGSISRFKLKGASEKASEQGNRERARERQRTPNSNHGLQPGVPCTATGVVAFLENIAPRNVVERTVNTVVKAVRLTFVGTLFVRVEFWSQQWWLANSGTRLEGHILDPVPSLPLARATLKFRKLTERKKDRKKKKCYPKYTKRPVPTGSPGLSTPSKPRRGRGVVGANTASRAPAQGHFPPSRSTRPLRSGLLQKLRKQYELLL